MGFKCRETRCQHLYAAASRSARLFWATIFMPLACSRVRGDAVIALGFMQDGTERIRSHATPEHPHFLSSQRHPPQRHSRPSICCGRGVRSLRTPVSAPLPPLLLLLRPGSPDHNRAAQNTAGGPAVLL